MIQVNSKHGPGIVGFVTSNTPRYEGFYDCLESLQVPAGTLLIRGSSAEVAQNRNFIIDRLMDEKETKKEWILFLDDDHAFPSDMLLDLLDRAVHIVSALYCRRHPPFDPVVSKHFVPGNVKSYKWEELNELTGMIQVDAVGAGALLVRKPVFDAMVKPYFRVGLVNYDRAWEGHTRKDAIAEDNGFCYGARVIGFRIHVDLDICIEHLTEASLLPQRQDGKFRVAVQMSKRM